MQIELKYLFALSSLVLCLLFYPFSLNASKELKDGWEEILESKLPKNPSPKSASIKPIQILKKKEKLVKKTETSSSEPVRSRSNSEGLPLAPTPTNRKASHNGDIKQSILIIEDSKSVWPILKSFIGRSLKAVTRAPDEFDILFTDNGADGILLHRNRKPFMVICDYTLIGGLTGLDVITTLRTECKLPKVQRNLGFVMAISTEVEQNESLEPDFICTKPMSYALFNKGFLMGLNFSDQILNSNFSDDSTESEQEKGIAKNNPVLSPKQEDLDL